MRITLKPFGPLDSGILEHLAKELRGFGIVEIAPGSSVPANAYVKKRNQYLASAFFGACRDEPGDRVLAITAADLFAEHFRFVFGYGTMYDRYAVVSTAHLGPAPHSRVLERIVKEAVHELGHTLGLDHDPDPSCVMHFSLDLEDTDRKGREFCATCAPAAEFTLKRLGR